MKLSKRIISIISKKYDLGEVDDVELIEGGLQNHNFLFTTKHGKFVVRFLRKKFHKSFLKLKKLEFDMLFYLQRSGFPYQVPCPLKSMDSNFISLVARRKVFVYNYLEGKTIKVPNNAQIRSIARALATYHKYASNAPFRQTKKGLSDFSWLIRMYKKMKKIDPQNSFDKLMFNNLSYFEKILNKILLIKFSGKTLPAHSDFSQTNLLFNGNNLVGVLDFDNIDWSLRSKDIAISVKSVCLTRDYLDESKLKIFLKEYLSVESLSKQEINSIKPLILRNLCIIFWWAYMGPMKDESKRMAILEHTIKRARSLEEAMHFL